MCNKPSLILAAPDYLLPVADVTCIAMWLTFFQDILISASTRAFCRTFYSYSCLHVMEHLLINDSHVDMSPCIVCTHSMPSLHLYAPKDRFLFRFSQKSAFCFFHKLPVLRWWSLGSEFWSSTLTRGVKLYIYFIVKLPSECIYILPQT